MSEKNRRRPDEIKQNSPENLSVEELHTRIAEDKKKAVRSLFMALSALVVMVGFCIAWFVSNNRVNATGMNITAASAVSFELASKGKRQDAEQNHLKNETDQTILQEGKPYLDVYYTGFSNLAWRLDENVMLMPGASGKLTFYIVPRKDNLKNAKLTFTLKAYKDDATTGRAVVSDDIQLQNLVMGHILFFQNRNADGSYESWIAPGVNGDYLSNNAEYSFEVSPENGFEKDKPYPVTLYWVWPNYIRNYVYTNQNGALFTNANSADYTKLVTFLNTENFQSNTTEQKYSKIFYVKSGSSTTTTNPVSGEISSSMTDAVLNECNECYNNADQYIGKNARYLYVDMSVDIPEDKN